MFYVYIIFSDKFNKYYISQTNNIQNRLLYHNAGYNAYTKPYIPWILLCSIPKNSRQEAMELERKLKNHSKKRLEQFIKKYSVPGPDES